MTGSVRRVVRDVIHPTVDVERLGQILARFKQGIDDANPNVFALVLRGPVVESNCVGVEDESP